MTSPLACGSHEVVINGASLRYHVFGEGPVVVVLPGGPGFSWDYLRMPLLEEKAKVVYFELVGTGDSARLASPADYSRARDVADLEGLRMHLGLDRVALLGHSAGGFLVQHYAIEHPDHVSRMVLFGTSATDGPEWSAALTTEMQARDGKAWFPAAAAALQGIFSRILSEDETKQLGSAAWPFYFFDYDADRATADRLLESVRCNAVRLQRGTRVPFDFREQLSALRVPALVIVGARDFICSPPLAKLLRDALPCSTLVTLERSGHMAHVEEPAAFAEAVASFLRE